VENARASADSEAVKPDEIETAEEAEPPEEPAKERENSGNTEPSKSEEAEWRSECTSRLDSPATKPTEKESSGEPDKLEGVECELSSVSAGETSDVG
jgi:hypothetical protein